MKTANFKGTVRMKCFAKLALAAVCSLSVASAALAQDKPASPEEQAQQAADLRQGLFKLMGWNMAPLAAMLRNRMPFDAAVAQKSALRIEQLAPMISDVFQQDTRKFKVETQAREGIWTNKSDFDAKAQELLKAANALVAASKTGDKGATLKAAGALGKACGNCHDNYRDE
jgi:cytochrome c556